MSDTLVKLRDIGKTYTTGKVNYEALRDVNLEIRAGEYVAILGPSGSGKSTLMQIIGCLATPTRGSYLLAGKEIAKLSGDELARIRNCTIGFIFQSFNLLAQLTVLENVALPLFYRGIALHKRQQVAMAVLEKLGLDSHAEHNANELSGGQQQRVAIARALVIEPEIILADEPTGNLDSKSGAEVIALLSQLNGAGKTIITVTHDIKLAEQAKRIIYIYDGRIKNAADGVIEV
jgi:putative ABC transport system ATP-binding protein